MCFQEPCYLPACITLQTVPLTCLPGLMDVSQWGSRHLPKESPLGSMRSVTTLMLAIHCCITTKSKAQHLKTPKVYCLTLCGPGIGVWSCWYLWPIISYKTTVKVKEGYITTWMFESHHTLVAAFTYSLMRHFRHVGHVRNMPTCLKVNPVGDNQSDSLWIQNNYCDISLISICWYTEWIMLFPSLFSWL